MLYLAQFDEHPQRRAAQAVVALGHLDRGRILADIEREPAEPTHPVGRILGARASEEDLREYPRLVADEIRAVPARRRRPRRFLG